jgi:hypothetical protein
MAEHGLANLLSSDSHFEQAGFRTLLQLPTGQRHFCQSVVFRELIGELALFVV